MHLAILEAAIEAAARSAHEVNRAYCIATGDTVGLSSDWLDAPEATRESARSGVRHVIEGSTSRTQHENWLTSKRQDGWKYGPVKDAEKKEHPCIVDYDDLPPVQKAKDDLFRGVVTSMLDALNVPYRTLR